VRLTLMPLIATAMLLTGLAIAARSMGTPDHNAANVASTDLSAARKKKPKVEESLKAAPSAPSTDGKSTY